MIVTVSWLDLTDVQRRDLLIAMEESFGKPVRDPLRFWKRSCRVSFYYPNPSHSWVGYPNPSHSWVGYPEPSHSWVGYPEPFGDWTGAAICWNQEGIEYMDKFFVRRLAKPADDGSVRSSPKGEGTRFLQELLRVTALVWRTDSVLAERFYGRIPGVRTVVRHGEYVYQGFHPICHLDQDALLGMIRIPSAF